MKYIFNEVKVMLSVLCNLSWNLLKLDYTEEENSGQAGF